VKVSQLSLKHRQNKSQRQRVILFVGHPLKEQESDFEELGVRMKRNNVAIDVINFAHPENVPKLQALVNAANNNNNSHFLDVPLGVSMITDVLIASPIVNESMDDMGGAGAANVGGGAGVGGASAPAEN
jgi:26S proteasome regulatory subunit N10